MEEVRLLVERAGGTAEAALRLWDAGYHSLAALARAEPEELARASGLSLPVARWLVGKALEELETSWPARPRHRRRAARANGLPPS